MLFIRNRRARIKFDWSHMGQCFVLERSSVILPRKYQKRRTHILVSCQLQQSRIRNAGLGVFLRESASTGQILLQYGGRKISMPEADRLVQEVY